MASTSLFEHVVPCLFSPLTKRCSDPCVSCLHRSLGGSVHCFLNRHGNFTTVSKLQALFPLSINHSSLTCILFCSNQPYTASIVHCEGCHVKTWFSTRRCFLNLDELLTFYRRFKRVALLLLLKTRSSWFQPYQTSVH